MHGVSIGILTDANIAYQRKYLFFLAVSATECIAIKSSAPSSLLKPPLLLCLTL